MFFKWGRRECLSSHSFLLVGVGAWWLVLLTLLWADQEVTRPALRLPRERRRTVAGSFLLLQCRAGTESLELRD